MDEPNILAMGRDELLSLDPAAVNRALVADEVVHIAKSLGAFWEFDHRAAERGAPGMHALLKSGRHSDGFFVSKILLAPPNILTLMAGQIVRRLIGLDAYLRLPDYIAGVPDGATALGGMVAKFMKVEEAEMRKVEGRIKLLTPLRPRQRILYIEDFCTRGTGFAEAVVETVKEYPQAFVERLDPCILNRGGAKQIPVDKIGVFDVLAVAERRVQDWSPEECPLCRLGSVPIKPKASDENWQLITHAQK